MPAPAHCCKPPLGVLNSHCVFRSVLCDIRDAEAAFVLKKLVVFSDRQGAGN